MKIKTNRAKGYAKPALSSEQSDSTLDELDDVQGNDGVKSARVVWFAEKVVEAKRRGYAQKLDSVRSLANNLVLILSFCFLFEATLFAGLSPSVVVERLFFCYPVSFVLICISNICLIAALFVSIATNLGTRPVGPVVSDAVIEPGCDEVERWILVEFALIDTMREDVDWMITWLDVARLLLGGGVASAALGIIAMLVFCGTDGSIGGAVPDILVFSSIVSCMLLGFFCLRKVRRSRPSQNDEKSRVQANYLRLQNELHESK